MKNRTDSYGMVLEKGEYNDFSGYVLWAGVEGFVENTSFSCTVVNFLHAFSPNIQEFVY